MTVLYKVNNANGHSFNATLHERLSLVESLRSANEILNDCGVIGDSMDDAVYNSVMSVAGGKEKGKNELRLGFVLLPIVKFYLQGCEYILYQHFHG